MSQLSSLQLVAAAVYLLPALVWAIVAADLWSLVIHHRPRNQVSRLLTGLTSGVAAFYLFAILFALLPAGIQQRRPPLLIAAGVAQDLIILATLAMTRHLALIMPLNAPAPSRRWLLTHYAIAALFAALDVFPGLIPAPTPEQRLIRLQALFFGYIIVMLALSVWHVARFARRGPWRPGALGDLRSADIITLIVGVVGSMVLFIAILAEGQGAEGWTTPVWMPLLNAAVGLALATPFAVRALGRVVRQLVVYAVNLAVTALLLWAATRLWPLVDPAVRPVLQLATVFLPVLVLIPLQPSLGAAANRLLFRRRLRRQAALQGALRNISPELGIVECCRRATSEFIRIMQLRGAGILLEPDGTTVVSGEIDMAPLVRAWPRGPAADHLPTAVFAGGVFRELPPALQEALIEADVVGVTPLVSTRRRWGWGFITTSVLNASFTLEEIEAVQALAGQFALVLDAAELLERARTVERTLAHREKLAAVGELAARVAHEIRNPVTAARSLAQLMVRDPSSPYAAEHADLILAELGRVERQVQALLRFARREEFSFEPVDLGDVARSALEPLRARLAASGVAVETDIDAGVVTHADRDKLRQVVVNLLDNAVDAVGGADDKRVALAVHGSNGTAVLEVCDSGPGVPADALARLFEPFFSLKTHGTGLGLAIVKRTVEAHGGRVEARARHGAGLLLRVELPAARASGAS